MLATDRPWESNELLTAEEEQALARRVHGPDPDDAARARNELVAANTRLVYDLARRYATRWRRPIEDMDQDGMVGLVMAAERYEPGRYRFSTYATYYIRQAIQVGIERDHTIPVSRRAWELLCGYRTKAQDSRDRAGILADAERAVKCRGYGSGRARGRGDDNAHHASTLEMTPARPEGPGEEPDRLDALRDAMRHLTDRERVVLRGRFDRGLKLAQLGDEMGLTKERVRQIEAHALERLRRYMEPSPGPPDATPGRKAGTHGEARAAAVARARAAV